VNDYTLPTWTPEEARQFACDIENAVKVGGWHVALGGSTLHRESTKDVDLILFPHCRYSSARPSKAALRRLHRALKAFGLKPRFGPEEMHKHWREKGSMDQKHVEVWYLPWGIGRGKRVDIIVLS